MSERNRTFPQARESGAGQHGAGAESAATAAKAPGEERAVNLTLRRATGIDLAPLEFFFDTALRRDYFVRRGQLADLLKSEHHDVFVAEIDLVLVGVAIMTRGARLVNALVHPAYRGLGIGRELVVASGAREVRAKLDMSTGDPRGFYRALGFATTGERNRKGNIELMARLDRPSKHEDGGERAAIAPEQSAGRARSAESQSRGERGRIHGRRKRGGI